MSDQENGTAGPEGEGSGIGRRDAIKKGVVGAGAVGVIWAAPSVTGLSLTPAYAAASSGVSPHCTADVSQNVTLGCTAASTENHQPSDAKGHQDAVIPSACGPLTLSIDQFWADIGSLKRGASADKPNTACNPENGGGNATANEPNGDFCDSAVVTRHDANGPFRMVTTKRNAGNTNCKFADIKYDGINNFFQDKPFTVNPQTGNRGGGATESGDKSSIGFVLDPNFVGDVGRVAQCGGTAHVHIKCT